MTVSGVALYCLLQSPALMVYNVGVVKKYQPSTYQKPQNAKSHGDAASHLFKPKRDFFNEPLKPDHHLRPLWISPHNGKVVLEAVGLEPAGHACRRSATLAGERSLHRRGAATRLDGIPVAARRCWVGGLESRTGNYADLLNAINEKAGDCKDDRGKIHRLVMQGRPSEGRRYMLLEPWSAMDCNNFLCGPCLEAAETRWKNDLALSWTKLPGFFGLDEWKDLKDDEHQ